MLTYDFKRRKEEIQRKIKEEQARWKNVPGERPDAHRRIQALEDELEKLEPQYAQGLGKRPDR